MSRRVGFYHRWAIRRNEHRPSSGTWNRAYSANEERDVEDVAIEMLHPHVSVPRAVESTEVGGDVWANGAREESGNAIGNLLAGSGLVGVGRLNQAKLKVAVSTITVCVACIVTGEGGERC